MPSGSVRLTVDLDTSRMSYFALVSIYFLALGCGFLDWASFVSAHDNGLAQTPPLGWRSWNLYEGNVHQIDITRIMDGMARRRHNRTDHLGNIISLADLGYRDVGLDDTWQRCNSPDAAEGMHYHDLYGNPIVNYDRFPSLSEMTEHAKKLNLTAGWYANNCACR
jgi:alpha-galactosidase